MLETRRGLLFAFLEVKANVSKKAVDSKEKAEKLKQNLLEVIEELDSFIQDCKE